MAVHPSLTHVMVELTESLVADFDVVDLLTVLSDRCVEVLDVDAAGVMLAPPGGDLRVMASSSVPCVSSSCSRSNTRKGHARTAIGPVSRW